MAQELIGTMARVLFILTFMFALHANAIAQATSKLLSTNLQNGVYTDELKAGGFHVRFTEAFSDADKLKVEQALLWADSIIETNRFLDSLSVIKLRRNKRINARKREGGKGLTPEERDVLQTHKAIYNQLKEGHDFVGEIGDGYRNLFLDLVWKRKKVKGATLNGQIWINKRYFEDVDVNLQKIAGNLVHEYMHVLGYKHWAISRKKRDKHNETRDVADAIGNVVYGWKRKQE